MKQPPLGLRLRATATVVFALAAGAGQASAKDSPEEQCLRQCTAKQLRQQFSASRVQDLSPARRSQWLAAAISYRRLDAVQALLAAGVDANHPYRFEADGEVLSASPLVLAVSARAGLPISQALVAAGARVHEASNGQWPVNLALSLGQLELAGWLLMQGAHADSADQPLRSTTLMSLALGARAADSSDVAPMARQLVERGAKVNAQDTRGSTALMFAVLSGHQALVQQLLELKSDPNVVTDRGETALSLARRRQRDDLVTLLLANGAR